MTQVDMSLVLQEFDFRIKFLRKVYIAMDSDTLYIKAAKEVAKKYKIKFSEILKHYKPSNNISKVKTWNTEGVIIR